jgi:hypothetical protein
MARGINIALIISLLLAAVGYFTEGSPIRWFAVTLFIQIVGTYMVNSAIRAWAQVQTNKLIAERENLVYRNLVSVRCAVCEELHDMEISVRLANEYRCAKCKSLNAVGVTVQNVQKTEIIPNGLITTDTIEQYTKNPNILS